MKIAFEKIKENMGRKKEKNHRDTEFTKIL
jgi:hypothetical protein